MKLAMISSVFMLLITGLPCSNQAASPNCQIERDACRFILRNENLGPVPEAHPRLDVSRVPRDEPFPLHAAIRHGRRILVFLLSRDKYFPGQLDNAGATPLHLAVEARGSLSIICILTMRDTRVDSPDARGETPFVRAMDVGRVDEASLLLALGADPAAYGRGPTSLYFSARSRALNLTVALLRRGISPDAKGGPNGKTALHAAAASSYGGIVRLLLDAGAPADVASVAPDQTISGVTPLHTAAMWSNLDAIAALIDAGASVDAVTVDGQTPLHYAARFGNTESIAQLVAAGADLHAVDAQCRTPMSIAATSGRADAVRGLMMSGYDPFVEEDGCPSSFWTAVSRRQSSVVAVMLTRPSRGITCEEMKRRGPEWFERVLRNVGVCEVSAP